MNKSKWIYDRLPTEKENDIGIVGIINGKGGGVVFKDALVLILYNFKDKCWYSEDYDISSCTVECWFPIPEYSPTEKGANDEKHKNYI